MNLYNILIVEDDLIVATDLQVRLNGMGYSVPRTVTNGIDALSAIQKQIPDLILLDIRLKGSLDGISVAEMIQKDYDIPIIFLTSNTDALTFERASTVHPEAFLSKPLREEDLIHAIELVRKNQIENEGDSLMDDTVIMKDRLFIKNKDRMERVFLKDIFYIKADGSYSLLVTAKQEYYLSIILKSVNERIQLENFVRIHRSYIVNILNMNGYNDLFVYFDEMKVPIGRAYKESFLKLIHSI